MLYDDIEPIDWEETIEKVATKISQLGLEAPAILMLEAHKPLTLLAGPVYPHQGLQGLIFLAPILYPFFGGKTERAAKFFEERENVEKLIKRVEQKADERAQNERAARAMRRAMRKARRERKTWRKL